MNCCRICLLKIEAGTSTNIFTTLSNNESISGIIKNVFGIQLLDDDNLPKVICSSCAETVNTSNTIKNLIISSDAHLRRTSGENQTEVATVKQELVEDVSCKSEGSGDTAQGGISDQEFYECAQCTETFPTRSQFTKHKSKHSEVLALSRTVCSKGFFQRKSLETHRKTQIEEKPYKCQHCSEAFKLDADLVQHNRNHLAEKAFSCDTCGKNFSTLQILEMHKCICRYTGDKPYACEICGGHFSGLTSLSNHLRSHNESKVPCHICGKFYNNVRCLRKHVKRHATETITYGCDVCKKRFFTKSYVQVHMKIHSDIKPYSCDACDKNFITAGNLWQHKKIHKNEKSFTCNFCDKSFHNRTGLTNHERVHTRVKPFLCTICDRRFSIVPLLRKHMKKFHPVEECKS